ncbi:MAG: ribonuclease J [Acholeplasmatales bacterium]|jgi:ribonuclease J|nr:ribonuclease J [Acholeplasmatales bacterium]
MENNNSSIKIIALGGLGEVGKNTYVYEINNKIFLVDAGILFPDDSLLGIDYVIPDYTYLVENEQKIVGLFITHGHEDHIGGIPFLLKKVKIPRIYASGIAVDLIEYKFQEHTEIISPEICEFKSADVFTFDDIKVSFIRLNHSIPDMFGIVIHTDLGPIFHTGDFKIDFTPVGPHAEYHKLTTLAENGCLCLLSDSTNAEVTTSIPSESKIGNSIRELFSKITQRIIIVTFASNIYRIEQIINATVESGRKIAVFGRSMEKAIEAGLEAGYIKMPKDTMISNNSIESIDSSKIVLLCTGSQGEPLAALSRIASGNHKYIKAMPGDTVIFSSSPIPGNQEGINKTINKLFQKGLNVIVNSIIADTHASGHGSQNDLKMMINLVKPKYFIPVHGEHRMLKTHKDLAIDCGVEEQNILIMDNGEVAVIDEEGIRKNGTVASGDIYIDGNGIGDIGSKVINERKLLSEEGIFVISLAIEATTKKLLLEPSIVSRGFIHMRGSVELTTALVEYIKEIVYQELDRDILYAPLLLKKKVEDELSKKIYTITLRKPLVIVVLTEIDSIDNVLPENGKIDSEV